MFSEKAVVVSVGLHQPDHSEDAEEGKERRRRRRRRRKRRRYMQKKTVRWRHGK